MDHMKKGEILISSIFIKAEKVAAEIFRSNVEVFDDSDMSDSIGINVILPKAYQADPRSGQYPWIETWDLIKNISRFCTRVGCKFSNIEIRSPVEISLGFHIPLK